MALAAKIEEKVKAKARKRQSDGQRRGAEVTNSQGACATPDAQAESGPTAKKRSHAERSADAIGQVIGMSGKPILAKYVAPEFNSRTWY